MDAVKLQLKKRIMHLPKENLSVPRLVVQNALKAPDPKQSLFDIFGLVPDAPEAPTVHDKVQLEALAYWTPEKGLAAREDAQWIGLRARISNLDDTHEGPFTLSAGQFKLIWDRLNNSEFKIRPSEQWSAFVADLLTASGKHFAEAGDDLFATFAEDEAKAD